MLLKRCMGVVPVGTESYGAESESRPKSTFTSECRFVPPSNGARMAFTLSDMPDKLFLSMPDGVSSHTVDALLLLGLGLFPSSAITGRPISLPNYSRLRNDRNYSREVFFNLWKLESRSFRTTAHSVGHGKPRF